MCNTIYTCSNVITPSLSATSLDCNDQVCPLVDATFTCQFDTGPATVWRYSPPANTLIGAVSGGTPTTSHDGYTATYNGNGESTLTFNAATDRNGTVIECQDFGDLDTDTCTITIAG